MPQFHKGKLKDVNMLPVGLANIRISTDYSQKPPRSCFQVQQVRNGIEFTLSYLQYFINKEIPLGLLQWRYGLGMEYWLNTSHVQAFFTNKQAARKKWALAHWLATITMVEVLPSSAIKKSNFFRKMGLTLVQVALDTLKELLCK